MSDEEIIRGICERDGMVMNRVIEKYSKLLWKITSDVLCGVGADADAEECVADVFISLWERPEAYDKSRGTLKSWLCMTARCKAIDRYRSLTRIKTVSIDQISEIVTDGAQETFLQQETLKALYAVIDSIEELERDILLRRYEDGQKPKMIAKALGITVKQVDNLLYRTKQKLRSKIEM